MKHIKNESHLRPRDYLHDEVVRIINQKQCMLYIKNKVYPIDIYTSLDDKTDKDVIVMIFLKEDTKDVFQKWCNYELE